KIASAWTVSTTGSGRCSRSWASSNPTVEGSMFGTGPACPAPGGAPRARRPRPRPPHQQLLHPPDIRGGACDREGEELGEVGWLGAHPVPDPLPGFLVQNENRPPQPPGPSAAARP